MSVQSKSTDLVKFNKKKSKLPIKFDKAIEPEMKIIKISKITNTKVQGLIN